MVSSAIFSIFYVKGLFLVGADSLLAALAGTGIGASTLTTNGQTLAVADATQAVDAGQTLERHLLLTAEVTLDEDVIAGDSLNNLGQLSVGESACAEVRRNTGLLKHLLGGGGADAVNVAQGGLYALLIGYFDTEKTSHNGVCVLLLVSAYRYTAALLRAANYTPFFTICKQNLAYFYIFG